MSENEVSALTARLEDLVRESDGIESADCIDLDNYEAGEIARLVWRFNQATLEAASALRSLLAEKQALEQRIAAPIEAREARRARGKRNLSQRLRGNPEMAARIDAYRIDELETQVKVATLAAEELVLSKARGTPDTPSNVDRLGARLIVEQARLRQRIDELEAHERDLLALCERLDRLKATLARPNFAKATTASREVEVIAAEIRAIIQPTK